MQAQYWNSFNMFDYRASHESHAKGTENILSPTPESFKNIDEGLWKVNLML